MVEGHYRKQGWEGEVTSKTKKTLLSMGKIEADKEEMVKVGLEVDVKNSEEFEQMQKDNVDLKERLNLCLLDFKNIEACTNIQCVKEILAARNGQEDDA